MGTGQITKMGMALAALLAVTAAQADTYLFRYKPMVSGTTAGGGTGGGSTEVSITLAERSFADATVGDGFTFDFSSLAHVNGANVSDLIWSKDPASVPPGLSLNGTTGVLSGTLSGSGEHEFDIVATHAGKEGRRTFTIKVGSLYLEAVQISSGSDHTCAVTPSGGVKCWGKNLWGQLGNASNARSSIPVNVNGLPSGVSLVTAGHGHTCALMGTGMVKCWGLGADGQLGNGATANSNIPVDVVDLPMGASKVVAGSYHTCAVTTSNGAKCWGLGASYRLGNNSTGSRSRPSDVTGLTSGVTSISVANWHSCVVHEGAAKCWGKGNIYGSLGDGVHGTESTRSTPYPVSGLATGVTSVAVGNDHSCALLASGGVRCWGQGSEGQLGTNNGGAGYYYPTPLGVSGLGSGVTAIEAGAYGTCALLTSGGMMCWGKNSSGQVGDGTSGTNRHSPTQVVGLTSGVTSISGGGDNVCAVHNGEAKCWGLNADGQIGDGTLSPSSIPAGVTAQ